MIKYLLRDHFKTVDTLSNVTPDVSGGDLEIEADGIAGLQVKGG